MRAEGLGDGWRACRCEGRGAERWLVGVQVSGQRGWEMAGGRAGVRAVGLGDGWWACSCEGRGAGRRLEGVQV